MITIEIWNNFIKVAIYESLKSFFTKWSLLDVFKIGKNYPAAYLSYGVVAVYLFRFKIVLFDTVVLISPSKCEGEIQVPERWSDSFY